MRPAEGEPSPRSTASGSLAALEPRATVGSGDAFLAGFVAARYTGRAAADCLPTASPAAPSPPSTSAPA